MNIIRKLTLRHLGAHRGRTVVTILGIVVSAAMITAVFVSMASFFKFYGDMCLVADGRQSVRFLDVDAQTAEDLAADARIKEAGRGKEAESVRVPNAEFASIAVGDGYAADETRLAQMLTGGWEGTLPKNEREIAVERRYLERNGLDVRVGDTLTLEVGVRSITARGETYTQRGTFVTGEQFRKTGTVTLTVTALLDQNAPTSEFVFVRGLSEREKAGVLDVGAVLTKQDHTMLRQVEALRETYDISGWYINKGFFESKLAAPEDGMLLSVFLPMVAVLLFIIMVAGVAMIYNAFAMSLSDKVRYLGMLASVGATGRQKRASIWFEGFILGLVGIPLGIAAGWGGMAITLRLVGQTVVDSGMVNGVENSGLAMHAVMPWWVPVGVTVCSALTIALSALIPARRAARVTPVEALKETGQVKLKARKLRGGLLARLLFRFPGELAHKNMRRNGRKTRLIRFSIALSVVLFLSVQYFCALFTEANSTEAEIPYQLIVSDVPEAGRAALEQKLEGERFYLVSNEMFFVDNTMPVASDECIMPAYRAMFEKQVHWFVNIVEDEAFDALCRANGLDPADYHGNTVRALLTDSIGHSKTAGAVFTGQVIGKQLDYNGSFRTSNPIAREYDNKPITVGALVPYDPDSYLFSLNPRNTVSAFIPVSTFFAVNDQLEAHVYQYGVETEEHERLAEEIELFLDQQGWTGAWCQDTAESMRILNATITLLRVFTYGFITLITLVTVFNIINTISTGIALRKREFAMLRSVGATDRELDKMVALESLFYGLGALVFGFPISVLISYGFHHMLAESAIPFHPDGRVYLAVAAAVLTLVGSVMVYSVRKLRKDSIIDALKTDTL